MKKDFSKWVRWPERDQLSGVKWPGVYILAVSTSDLSGKAFQWIPEINYIGMTNSQSGLRSRLRQFDNTIRGKEGHGGGCRFRYKYKDYDKLIRKLYVSVRPFECNVKSFTPGDLRCMGEVAKLEYCCLADYVQRYRELPEFNDKKRSLKR